jgi:arylsulfatase A-like enzyme
VPNLLFLYTDEQRCDTLEAYGNRRIAMPNINRLARTSTIFDRAYCTQPVCTPSRGSIVTGLYPHTHRTTVNNVALPAEVRCLPQMLPEARYACGHFGKWHLGDEIYPQHGFTDWRGTEDTYHATFQPPHFELTPDRSTYHHWLVSRGVRPKEINATLPPEKRNPIFDNRFFRDQIHAFPEEHSRPAFLAEQAMEFMSEHRAGEWVLYVNFLEPHMPFHSCRDNQYSPDEVDVPAAAGFELTADFPLRQRIAVARSRQRPHDERELRQTIARYWGMCSLVDTHVGRMLGRLSELGLMDQTIVVLTSDHGDMMGSHGLHAKGWMYDESACVPMLLRLPGQAQQRRVRGPVSQIDLVPTLLDLMGHGVPSELPGATLRAQVDGRRMETGRDVFVEWNTDHRRKAAPSLPDYLQGLCTAQQAEEALAENIRSIATSDGWKMNLGTAGDHELYDLNTDPLETRNLARDAKHRDRMRQLRGRIAAWQEKTADPLVLPSVG